MTPQTIGRYQIHGVIERTPSSHIYLGRGPDGRLMAIKVLADSEDVSKPDQAKLVQLSHPNIVSVAEVRPHQDTWFVAMELVRGVWLSELMEIQPKLPLDVACRIAADAAAGVHALHEHASLRSTVPFVHRGVRPDVFAVTTTGQTKLMKAGYRATTSSRIERLAARMRYFAPEQLATAAVDRRADVFALGILLWELTVGEPIHAGKSGAETALRIVRSKPRRPSSVIPSYPPALEEVVMRALAAEPADRYPNAGALATAIHLLSPTIPLADDAVMAALATANIQPTNLKLDALIAGIPPES